MSEYICTTLGCVRVICNQQPIPLVTIVISEAMIVFRNWSVDLQANVCSAVRMEVNIILKGTDSSLKIHFKSQGLKFSVRMYADLITSLIIVETSPKF
jgi:hypothetical protein